MITGFDYVFYSPNPHGLVVDQFVIFLKNIWNLPIVEELERSDNRIELFYSKDYEMNLFFEENGYALDLQNEGCFMLIARKLNNLEMHMKIESASCSSFGEDVEPYDACGLFEFIWEYTLVLPSCLNESVFSTQVYNFLKKSLIT